MAFKNICESSVAFLPTTHRGPYRARFKCGGSFY